MHRNRGLLIITVLVHIGALLPLALLVWDFTQGQLTASPAREIQLRTGRYTLILLTLTLACRPVYNFTGLTQALALRRTLGLSTFMYAFLHLLNLIGLDYLFDFPLLWEDINNKRYIIAGFIAFLILLALAVTSTLGWKRRLGRNWERLHWLVYAAGILAFIHYLWQIKVYINAPLIYGIIIVILLLTRIPMFSRVTAKYFNRRGKNTTNTTNVEH